MLGALLLWSTLAAAAPVGTTEPTLAPNVAAVVAETDLARVLSTLGPGPQVVLVTSTKGNASALYNVLGASGGYRYVQAGSASESLRPIQAMGAQCGAFLARQPSGLWKVTAIGLCPIASAQPAAPVLAAQPATAIAVPPPAVAPAPRPADVLLTQVLAAPDPTGRKRVLTDALASGQLDGETAGIVGQALAVVGYLETTQRTDPSIVRMFLTAAFSTDAATRGAAVDAAKAGGDPPSAVTPAADAVTPPTVAVPRASPDPALLRKYNSQHLVRGSLDLTVGSVYGSGGATYGSVSTISTWTVRDGAGAPLNTFSFAERVGDTAGLARAQSKRSTAQALGIGGFGVGSILYIASLAALAGDDLDPNRDRQLRTATGLLVAGTVAYIPGVVGVVMWGNVKHIAKNYRPDEADRWIEKYNAGLRADLGLSEQDVQAIDTK
jgi:hypothetical protein